MQELTNFPLESQKMEVIGRLATSVIHDLNNLLTLAQLNAALLEQGGMSEGEVVDIAGKIGQACMRSADLTRKVLDLARRRERVQESFDVGGVVRTHTDLVRTFVSNRAELSVAVDGEDLWVVGDPGEIEQVLLNLILNAADAFTGRGEVRVECRAVGGADGSIEISVGDDGPGIPEEMREKIFEPLFTTKPKGVGTGMGLFTVRRVVERHGGEIEVESEVGRGSRFVVRLPRASTGSAAVTKVATGGAGPGPPRGRLLLLVEDDPGIRDLAKRILVGAGLRVVDVADGDAALAAWERQKEEIDLVLADLVLPGELSGRDVALAILRDRPDFPILYMSGFADDGEEHPYLTEENFLRKPFSPDALKRTIAAALR